MCVEIHYYYPTCSCLAKVGKYACYTARTPPPPTTTTSNTTNVANSTSTPPSLATGIPQNPFSDDNAISLPEITITSSSGTTDLFASYNERPLSTFTTAPLSLSPSKNNLVGKIHNDKGVKFTIRTLLSNRLENISQIDHLGISKFNVQCEHFKITEQVMRTGMPACSECWKRIEQGGLEGGILQRKEKEEGKRVWEMVEGDMEVIRKRGNASIETLLGEIGGLGSEGSRDDGGNRGFPDIDGIERELRDIQRYANGGEEDRESWESVNDEEEMELLVAAAVKRPSSSLGRRRSNSQ